MGSTLHQGLADPELFQFCDAIITDPPYGISNDCDYTRFSGGLSPSRNFHQKIAFDQEPFDPSPWLSFPKVVLFGSQFFAQRLPMGSCFVWNKKRENQLGKFLSDCELAWFNKGKGCYLFQHVWNGFDRESERGEKSLHPCQKPVALWEWVIDKIKLPPGSTIGDPYMGSGSVGIAALNRGMNYVGAEVIPDYFEVAKKRITAHSQTLKRRDKKTCKSKS